jgi:hypothetical protein
MFHEIATVLDRFNDFRLNFGIPNVGDLWRRISRGYVFDLLRKKMNGWLHCTRKLYWFLHPAILWHTYSIIKTQYRMDESRRQFTPRSCYSSEVSWFIWPPSSLFYITSYPSRPYSVPLGRYNLLLLILINLQILVHCGDCAGIDLVERGD